MSERRAFLAPPPARRPGPQAPRRTRKGRHAWRRLALAAGFLLLGLGGWQLGAAGYIHVKAWLAQMLLTQAWAEILADNERRAGSAEGGAAVDRGAAGALRRPWPWADTGPVARLRVPALGVDEIVLAGASGRTLAFGPGHLGQTAPPGTAGHSVISGHRDTHFAFLADLAPAMKLEVQRPDGGWRRYQVQGGAVIDARSARLAMNVERPAVTLVTCWPFDTVAAGGPLRYAVTATEIAEYLPPAP